MRVYPIFLANRGCPHRCLFCEQKQSNGTADVLQHDTLQKKLDQLLPGKGDGEIAFFGGSFTLLPESLQAACLSIAGDFIRAGRVAGVRLSTRPDGLPGQRLEALAAAGVTTIEIGCQSFDSMVLTASRRGHSVDDIVTAATACRSFGFKVGLQLMPGLPGAEVAEALDSLRQALALQPDFLRIYPTLVMQGTALAELWRAGRYQPWSLERAVDVCADLLLLCRQAGVPVIRLGLQQDPTLEQNLLAGPHHPAFGQLVRSRLWRRAVEQLPADSEVLVNPRDLSDALGHGAQNREWLLTRRPAQSLRTDQAVAPGQVVVGGECWSLEELARKAG